MASGLSNERVLRKLLEQMNSALPARRIWLSELLEMKSPSYKDRDGREYALDRSELLLIRDILSGSGLKDVRIPILLFSDTSQEQSAWRVEGSEECSVIARLLNREVREPMYLYLAHMSVIRRKLPTTTVGVFM